ncbi:MAG TPA: EthD domain-containing protein [Candidatus Binataceae bacterium]|nr:EthD domain-containing protein [Candidatus Binataceae bacterium]
MIKLVYVIRKRADVSAEEFHDYWLHKHGPLVAKVAKAIHARKYVQSHTILPEVAAALSSSRGMAEAYDGITEVWWDSVEESRAGSSTPEGQEAGRLLRQDESKFIDFQRSTIFMTEEHLIFDFQGKG